MPERPTASRSAGGCSAASKWRWKHPSRRDCWHASDPKGAGAGVRKHTRPRTRTRPSDWGVASVTALVPRTPRANGAARPKDVAAPADKQEGRCASPDGQSAHRPPVSFARFSTALSRSADYPPTRLRRAAPLVRHRRVPPAHVGIQTDFQDETALRGSDDGGQAEVSLRLVGHSVGRSTTSTTASEAIKFRRVGRAASEPGLGHRGPVRPVSFGGLLRERPPRLAPDRFWPRASERACLPPVATLRVSPAGAGGGLCPL